jgi:hypothetical protein
MKTQIEDLGRGKLRRQQIRSFQFWMRNVNARTQPPSSRAHARAMIAGKIEPLPRFFIVFRVR